MRTNRHRFKPVVAFAVVSLLFVGTAAYAASILEFDRWMRHVEKKMLSVQKHIRRGNSQDAVTEAKEIEELYRLMQVFFENRSDATKGAQMSRDGREAAAQMASHAAAGNFEKAQASARVLADDCRPCHREYKPFD